MQNSIFSLYGYYNDYRRYGGNYKSIMDDILSRDLSNKDEILKLQTEKLNIQFEVAKQSKYWAKKFSDYDINIGNDPFEELKKLPLLSKEEVRKNVSNIYVSNFSNKILKISTSGTTGAGLSFYETRETEWHRWATWWRYRREYGWMKKLLVRFSLEDDLFLITFLRFVDIIHPLARYISVPIIFLKII